MRTEPYKKDSGSPKNCRANICDKDTMHGGPGTDLCGDHRQGGGYHPGRPGGENGKERGRDAWRCGSGGGRGPAGAGGGQRRRREKGRTLQEFATTEAVSVGTLAFEVLGHRRRMARAFSLWRIMLRDCSSWQATVDSSSPVMADLRFASSFQTLWAKGPHPPPWNSTITGMNLIPSASQARPFPVEVLVS